MIAAVLVVAALAAAPSDREHRAASLKVQRLEARLREAVARTTEHTAVFYKREHKDGALQPAEHVDLRWRAATATRGPQVKMEWIAGLHEGRVLAWSGGRTVKVKAGLLALDLDVDGRLVRSQSRNSVRRAGLVEIAKIVLADIDRAQARKLRGVTYQDLGQRNVHGALAHCWGASLPKEQDPAFYGKRSEVCVDARTSLPSLVRVCDDVDGRLELVEDYSFADIRVNPGLTDDDFDL